jgi:hypothetical protein
MTVSMNSGHRMSKAGKEHIKSFGKLPAIIPGSREGTKKVLNSFCLKCKKDGIDTSTYTHPGCGGIIVLVHREYTPGGNNATVARKVVKREIEKMRKYRKYIDHFRRKFQMFTQKGIEVER